MASNRTHFQQHFRAKLDHVAEVFPDGLVLPPVAVPVVDQHELLPVLLDLDGLAFKA